MAITSPESKRWIAFNDRLCDILGYPRQELVKLTWVEITHPEDIDQDVDLFQAVLRGEREGYGIDKRFLRKDGRIVHATIDVKAMRRHDGSVDFFLATIQDITERKRQEQRLRERAAFHQAVLDSLAAHVAVLDPSGTILAVNRSWMRFAEQNGAHHHAVGPGANYLRVCEQARQREPASVDPVLSALSAVLTGTLPFFSCEYPCHSPDTRRWFHLQASPLAAPSRGAVISHIDITDRKLAEEKIAQLFEILDHAGECILVRDLDGRVQYANKGCERMFGWTLDELRHRRLRDIACRQPKDFDAATAALRDQGSWSGQFKLVHKSGREFPAECNWTLVPRPGEPDPVVVDFSRDISERVRLEAQFLRAQRMENIGMLASGIAHDLNNILTPILLSAPVLAHEPRVGERSRWAELIEISALRATGIIRQLLAFGRGGESTRTLHQPRHLLKELGKIVRSSFPASITWEEQVSGDLWPVQGDPTQLHQVFLNLAVNARDAMPQGGTIALQATNRQLDAHYAALDPDAAPGAYIRIQIRDTGPGFPEAIRTRLFEPFFTTKPAGQGTGLGLATALTIVKAHGGFIQAQNHPSGGAAFTVWLPAASSESITASVPSKGPNLGQGETILVVDAEPLLGEAFQRTLESHGYRVLPAGDSVAALALFAQHRAQIDLVITDLAMPLLDGWLFTETIRRIHPRIPVMLSSSLPPGTAPHTSRPAPRAADLLRVLPRPHTAAELLEAVAQLLVASRNTPRP